MVNPLSHPWVGGGGVGGGLGGVGGGGIEDHVPQSHSREVAVETYPEFKAI